METQSNSPVFIPNTIFAYISAPNAPACLLSTEEAAQALNLRKNTLEIWRLRGKGPQFIKLGNLVRYRSQDILAYIEGRQRSSTSDTGEN